MVAQKYRIFNKHQQYQKAVRIQPENCFVYLNINLYKKSQIVYCFDIKYRFFITI